ncbi:MAG: lysostaphin resistance A-like protein [Methanosarcina sp.]
MAVPEFPPSELDARKIPLSELGKMFKSPTEEKTGFLEKVLYAGVPTIVIFIAELLIFGGRLKEATIAYIVLLLAFSFSTAFTKKQDVREIHQAFLLLPIFRLVNISMPIFLKTNLYSFAFIYAPLLLSVLIAFTHQNTPFENKRHAIKKLWIYLPLSLIGGLIFAEVEYFFLETKPLVSDLSPLNLLAFIFIMIFIVALVEEYIFRGILQTRLEGFLGPTAGILLASLLFGIMHSGYGNPYEMIFTFFFGTLLGYYFYKTRSLLFVIMIHGLTNVFLYGIIPHLGSGLGLT